MDVFLERAGGGTESGFARLVNLNRIPLPRVVAHWRPLGARVGL